MKFILVSLGGIETLFDTQRLPVLDNVAWIVPDEMANSRQDIIPQSTFALPYIDLLASVDVIVTKTGYGAMVEAITLQKPMLCLARPDWPEQPALFSWSHQHGYLQTLLMEQLGTAIFQEAIKASLSVIWAKPAVKASGAQQAATILLQRLRTL
ncbi:MAG: hypothetical protein V3W04_07060 [Gammaproteobacteria bacterium]